MKINVIYVLLKDNQTPPWPFGDSFIWQITDTSAHWQETGVIQEQLNWNVYQRTL